MVARRTLDIRDQYFGWKSHCEGGSVVAGCPWKCVLKDICFMCCFRFSLWWMMQRMGNSRKDVPMETKFFLCESKLMSSLMPESTFNEDETVYTIFLPLLEGSFRASLQGNVDDQLELYLESGGAAVKGKGGLHSVYLHAGTNPFKSTLIACAMLILICLICLGVVEMHLQTFRRREEKEMPDILNRFGWCTWDAFYTNVSADEIRQGLKRQLGQEAHKYKEKLQVPQRWEEARGSSAGSGLPGLTILQLLHPVLLGFTLNNKLAA
ncbi:hypothetical protein GOP47_0024445 [Adiantum capillus-veneris]|uniref:Uncharacterized protein n=1 Tax=Adiantum capillus-veneris TaxID=13818 RepID=A0A9D4Z3N8_ADICA|nr:hypothetical protein GOP47_0024445 [Adiantum capillus-veneris]